ncbi:MAG: hypothetical protein GX605_09495 [Chloroflexi bacterium]|nr:hypothetical protein [Chloroflexota bacterium]
MSYRQPWCWWSWPKPLGLALDRIAALLVVVLVLVAKTGWDLLSDAMRVLLDASLDAETLGQVRSALDEEPSVAEVAWVTGRDAGRYRFIEADVRLRGHDLEKAHAGSQRLEGRIREALLFVGRVLIHDEPIARTSVRCAPPLQTMARELSPHFGEAPYFGLVTVKVDDGAILPPEVLANPFAPLPKAKGVRVAEWLVGRKTDAVLFKESLQGRWPEYVFADAGVEMRPAPQAALQEAALADAV